MSDTTARATHAGHTRPGRRTPPVLLVIGAHRGELGFGEQVAAHLDPATFDVLRIPLGLSGQRPLPDELASWRRRHGELYLQILERVQPGQQLLIDLHTGIDELRRSADVFCAAPSLLARIAAAGPVDGDPVRVIQLVADTSGALGDSAVVRPFPLARPDPPPMAWDCVFHAPCCPCRGVCCPRGQRPSRRRRLRCRSSPAHRRVCDGGGRLLTSVTAGRRHAEVSGQQAVLALLAPGAQERCGSLLANRNKSQ
jgi:hypothetical protein